MLTKILVALAGLAIFSVEIILVGNKHTSGYIINSKNDTLKTIFKLALNKYRLTNDSTYHPLEPSYVKEFHVNRNNLTYRSILLQNDGPKYMLLKDSGHVDLYHYHELHGKSGITYLIAQKKDQQPVTLLSNQNNSTNKVNLSSLISDNQQALDMLNHSKKYNEETIINVIKLYNGHR